MARPRLAVVTAAAMTLEAFWPVLLRRAEESFDLTLIASGADEALVRRMGVRARAIDLPMARRPSPWSDLRARRALRSIMARERFDLVHSQTPKAGLLAMGAARSAGIPVRIHTFTGQVWATARGPWRRLLRALDRHTARAATHLLADSASQADFLAAEGIAPRERLCVLGAGSISGVDGRRFRPDAERRTEVRRELGAAPDDEVLLFLGRLTRDKGVPELLAAFARLASRRPALRLWLVGPDEGAAAFVEALDPALRPRVALPGATREPERFMAAADLLLLPSHREGFGSTIIEAAACGIPAVASRIYGLVDAVVDGETGLLHPPGDVDAIASLTARLLDDPALRRRLGERARARAVAEFDPAALAEALAAFHHAALAESLAASHRAAPTPRRGDRA